MISKNTQIVTLAVLFFLLLNFCNPNVDELQRDKINPYSISLGGYKTYENAFNAKMKLSDSVRSNLRLEFVAKKNYKLLYGKYPNSYDAGDAAFRLFQKKYIKSYEINKNGLSVLDEFANVPFIGFYLGKPSLFNYNIKTKQTEVLWSRFNKKVLSASLTPKAKDIIIITAETISKNNWKSSLQKSAIHFLVRNEDESKELIQIGNIDRIYSYWDHKDTFRVNVTFPDSSNPRIIYQRIYPISKYGKMGKPSQRSFDLLLQGYPKKPLNSFEEFSPNGIYKTRISVNNQTKYIYIKNFQNKSELLALTLQGEIKNIKWSEDSRYVIFHTDEQLDNVKMEGLNKQLLAIYDTIEKKVVRIIERRGFSNLLLRRNILFFDESLRNSSHIVVINITDNTVYDTINLPGGSALNIMPD